MGFIRQGEVGLARKLLVWRYQKIGATLPSSEFLDEQAKQVVDDAHRIGRERGKNVVAIMKKMVNDIVKR